MVALHVSAQAATITVSPPDSSGIAFIEVVGDFENGDEEVFRIKTSGLTKAVVAFGASDGGSLVAGIRMSHFQNSWGSRVFEGVSGLGAGQAGAGSYLNSLMS